MSPPILVETFNSHILALEFTHDRRGCGGSSQRTSLKRWRTHASSSGRIQSGVQNRRARYKHAQE